MTLEQEVAELRRRVAELEAQPTDPKYMPIRTPWMDGWRPIAPAPTVLYVMSKEMAAKYQQEGGEF